MSQIKNTEKRDFVCSIFEEGGGGGKSKRYLSRLSGPVACSDIQQIYLLIQTVGLRLGPGTGGCRQPIKFDNLKMPALPAYHLTCAFRAEHRSGQTVPTVENQEMTE